MALGFLGSLMEIYLHIPPSDTELFDPVRRYGVRIDHKERSAAISCCPDSEGRRLYFGNPIINLCIVAASTPCVVMIDHSGASFGQRKGLRQGQLFSECRPAFAAIIVICQAIVRVGEHEIAARQGI